MPEVGAEIQQFLIRLDAADERARQEAIRYILAFRPKAIYRLTATTLALFFGVERKLRVDHSLL